MKRADPQIDDWLAHLAAVRGLAPSTLARYRRAVVHLAEDQEIGGWASLDAVNLDNHLRNLYVAGAASSTRAGGVSAIRSFCEFLALRGVIGRSPAKDLRAPRVYQTEAPHLTRAEVLRLCFGGRPGTLPSDVLAARDQMVLAISYHLGLRASEPGELRLDEIGRDERGYSVLLAGKRARGDLRRPIFDVQVGRMLAAYLASFRSRLPGGPWLFPSYRGGHLGRGAAAEIFRRAATRAEIEPRGRRLSFHALRHSLATQLSQDGWPIKEIQSWMRHRDVKTTMRYAHATDASAQRLWQHKHPLKRRRRVRRHLAHELLESIAQP